jgi:hypothetical protein
MTVISNVPAPVALDVNDADIDAMRAEYRRRSRVPRPAFLIIGIAYVGLGIADWLGHRGPAWFWVVCGVILMAFSLYAGKDFPSSVRPTGLHFSEDGLDLDVAFEKNPRRHYSWGQIRTIDDIGESFVLVPKYGKRAVLTKRSFPDGGNEAWAFFTAHGVSGRRPSVAA